VNPPRVFFDADVIFSAAASPHQYGASQVTLRLAQYTLIDGIASEQSVAEAERNLRSKLPESLPAFREIVRSCLRVVPNPEPASLMAYRGMADTEDLPILVAAVNAGCGRLFTFNTRHFWPPPSLIMVERPGQFLVTLRAMLGQFAGGQP
jgi:hypothetical protein